MHYARARLFKEQAFANEGTSAASLDNLERLLREENLAFTPLIGREQERNEVAALLAQSEIRLLTLTGPGGIGKTRLARQVVTDLVNQFADGTCFVSLATIDSPALVFPVIAKALKLRGPNTQSSLEQIKDFLHEKNLLLALDNFEHVTAASSMLAEVLAACPLVKILATSRVLLHVWDEYEFPVPPLPLPNKDDEFGILAQTPSIVLFVQRAQAANPTFTLTAYNAPIITEICKRLDCLPLAIELAAARLKILSPRELLARLENRLQLLNTGGPDLPSRQQTMHNTIQWSYDLLTRDEQRLFRYLSVFVGGCTLEAVERLCAHLDPISLPTLDGVRSLLDKSLLRLVEQTNGKVRLTMLETIKAFGLACITTMGEVEWVRDAHVSYYDELIAKIHLPAAMNMYASLEQEYENIVSALRWVLERGERPDTMNMALVLARVVGRLAVLHGQMKFGYDLLQRVVSLSRKSSLPVAPLIKAEALYITGWISYRVQEYEQGEKLVKEALALFRKENNSTGVLSSLNTLASTALDLGNFEDADKLFAECLQLSREVKNQFAIGNTLLAQSMQAFFRGNFAQVQTYSEESLRIFEKLNEVWPIALNQYYLGWVAYSQGEHERAHRLLAKSVSLLQGLSHPNAYIEVLTVFAYVTAVLGDISGARTMLELALPRERELGNSEDLLHVVYVSGRLAWYQNDLVAARAFYEEGLTLFTRGTGQFFKQRWLVASCLEDIGRIALAQEHVAGAVLLFGAAEALRTMNEHRNVIRMEQQSYQNAVDFARSKLGPQAFAAIWTEGLGMTAQQALAASERA